MALFVVGLTACGTGEPADGGRRADGGGPATPGATGSATRAPMTGGRPAAPTSRPPVAPGTTAPRSTTPRDVDWFIARLPTFATPPAAQRMILPNQPGEAAWIKRIPTNQRVAFITIDDGWTKRPEAARLLRASRVPVTLFLTVSAIRTNPGYFKTLQQNGAVIEAHTITHRKLRGLPYADQKQEICGSADWLGAQYGRRPVLFRPPYGEKDDNTLRAAHDCGIQACFYWTQTVDKGNVVFQGADHTIRPGDIILMHFREAYADDFLAALLAIKAAGLTPALLENYVSVHSDG